MLGPRLEKDGGGSVGVGRVAVEVVDMLLNNGLCMKVHQLC